MVLKLLPRLPFQWVKWMHVSIVRSPTWEHSLLVFTVHTYSRMAIKIISSVKDLNIHMWKIDFFRADTKNYSNHMSCSYYLSLVNLPFKWVSNIINKLWFSYPLAAIRQQDLTWTNADRDLYRQIASPSLYELKLTINHAVSLCVYVSSGEIVW